MTVIYCWSRCGADGKYNSDFGNFDGMVFVLFACFVAESKSGESRRMVDITRDKPIKVAVRVVVPVRDHPKVRYIVAKININVGDIVRHLQSVCL